MIDRGGDREVLYEKLLEKQREFIIRLVGTRKLRYRGSEQVALALVRRQCTNYCSQKG